MANNVQEYRLEDCMDAIIDYRGKTPKKTTSGIPLITAKIVKNGRIQEVNEYIAEEDYDSWMRRGIPETGDIVLTTEAPLGEVAQLDNRRIALAQRVITLRGKKELLDNDYLKYLLLSKDVQHQLDGRGTGTTVKGIKQSELREVILRFPDFKTQKVVAHHLKTIDEKIELNRKTNQTLEQMAQALFKSWFVDFNPVFDNALANGMAVNDFPEALQKKAQQRQQVQQQTATGEPSDDKKAEANPLPEDIQQLFPSEFEQTDEPSIGINGWIPKGWFVSELSQFIKFANGKAKKSSDGEKYPIYGANGIIGQTDESKFNNAVIVGRVGAYCGAIEYCRNDFWSSDNTIVATSKLSEEHIPHILYLLKFLDLNQYAGGAAQPLLNQTTLNRLKIPFSNVECMMQFNNIIDGFLLKQVKNTEQNQELVKIRDTLLPKLISGEISINSIQ